MKNWPHVEVIKPAEKLSGYQPPQDAPSPPSELWNAAMQAKADGLDRVVLKAIYPPAYQPYGETRNVLPGVTGLCIGGTGRDRWVFMVVKVLALLRCARRMQAEL